MKNQETKGLQLHQDGKIKVQEVNRLTDMLPFNISKSKSFFNFNTLLFFRIQNLSNLEQN